MKLVEWIHETPGMTVTAKRTAKNTKRAGEFREWLAGNLDSEVQDEIDEVDDDEFMAIFLQLAVAHNNSTRAKPKTLLTRSARAKRRPILTVSSTTTTMMILPLRSAK